VWRSGAWHKDPNLKVEAVYDDDVTGLGDHVGNGLSRALDRGLALNAHGNRGGGGF